MTALGRRNASCTVRRLGNVGCQRAAGGPLRASAFVSPASPVMDRRRPASGDTRQSPRPVKPGGAPTDQHLAGSIERPMKGPLAIGVDIGGTFTDFVGTRPTGALLAEKVSSTPRSPAEAVFVGLESLLAQAGLNSSAVSRFVHGTTVGTNAVLERKGARVGLLTTQGFEDALEIGRLERSDIYDLFLTPETPTFVAPRRVRLGIRERLGPSGEVLVPLHEEDVDRAAHTLRERNGVEAIAVCYLFAFRNPSHERRTLELIRSKYPDLPVSLSSDVDPRFREYERLCTTVFDAYLRPVVAQYLGQLQSGLANVGVRSRLFIMQSSGGLYTADAAIERPVSTLKSGLAGGVNGASAVAQQAGYSDIITIDIGGTSCDVALIRGGRPVTREENRLQTYPLRVPMVDVNTIGAGGGSIAWLDAAGGLHVGPRSAGAEPGPACYGRGGSLPTVTDASLVLGYLNPRYFAGGRIPLDPDAAHRAVAQLARALRLSVPETAHGIHRIVNAAMANEIRKVSLQRGHDTRRFALLLLGGAGPVHGCQLARELGINTVLVPELPGLLCAYGLLVSSVSRDHLEAYHVPARQLDAAALLKRCRDLDETGRAALVRDGAAGEDVRVRYTAQMRYIGQSYEIDVDVSVDDGPKVVETMIERFHTKHEDIYGRCSRSREAEIVNIRASHEWPQARPEPHRPTRAGHVEAARKASRPVYFAERGGYEDVPIYERERLPVGAALVGPTVIEQPDTTTVVGYGQRLHVNAHGHLVISVESQAR